MKIDREKYEKLSRGEAVPYCFEIKKKGQFLFYFGANHSHDPKNKQYSVLRQFWKKFLKIRGAEKLVVVEGRLREIRKSEKIAIESGAEGSLVTIWAHKVNISVVCPEPSEHAIIITLKKKFSKNEIYYYRFACLIDSWRRHNPRPNFTKWITKVMKIYSQRFKFNRKDFILPKMKATHKNLFGKKFSLKNLNFFNNITNPNRIDTIVNQVARTSSDIRDVKILKTLVNQWKTGKNLFIVYGCGHAFLHKPVLKKYL